MKAVLMDGFGDAGVLRWGDAPRPEPGPGQVLIEAVATSVNRADVSQREGKYPPPPTSKAAAAPPRSDIAASAVIRCSPTG